MSFGYVVSIVPKDVKVSMPGVFPGNFLIKKPVDGVPTVIEVKDAVYYRYVGEAATPDKSGSIQLIQLGTRLAQSIVEDYINSQYATSEGATPGLEWLDHKPTAAELSNIVANLTAKQIKWFNSLVRLADDEWQKYHQHKFITEVQRMAANALGLDKEWAKEPQPPKKCPACLTYVDPAAIVCNKCNCILDPEKFKTLKFA